MSESLFRYAGLPSAVMLLTIGTIMLSDILSHGRGPDELARKWRFGAWLVDQARLGQQGPPKSKALAWWRLAIAWGAGYGILWLWVAETFNG